MAEREIIVAAAIRINGVVCAVEKPGRHHDVIHRLAGAFDKRPIVGVQGFVTSAGRFVDRFEAARIATAADQILPVDGSDGVAIKRDLIGGRLFSEDVW